jgi:hypothetical protein
MKFSGRTLATLAMMALLSLFLGCGGGGGGDSSGGAASTGTLSMSMTDAKPMLPSGVTNCFVTIDEVMVHSSGGGWESLPMVQTPYTIDLLQFTDGATTELVPPVALGAEKYTQIRLSVIRARLKFESSNDEVEITIPSENLKTDKNFDFDLSQGTAVDITIDFDLSKSIVVEGPAGNPSYKLKPVLHIVETVGAATIEGTIDDAVFEESYAVITVFDSTGQEYTKVRVDKDDAAADGKTAYSIFWLVPNQAYTVKLNRNPVADDDSKTEDVVEETYEITVDVPSDSDEDQTKYPEGILSPGAVYELNFAAPT